MANVIGQFIVLRWLGILADAEYFESACTEYGVTTISHDMAEIYVCTGYEVLCTGDRLYHDKSLYIVQYQT